MQHKFSVDVFVWRRKPLQWCIVYYILVTFESSGIWRVAEAWMRLFVNALEVCL